jgi:hypothetical protein
MEEKDPFRLGSLMELTLRKKLFALMVEKTFCETQNITSDPNGSSKEFSLSAYTDKKNLIYLSKEPETSLRDIQSSPSFIKLSEKGDP